MTLVRISQQNILQNLNCFFRGWLLKRKIFCFLVISSFILLAFFFQNRLGALINSQTVKLEYSTDFENVVCSTQNSLNMSVPNTFVFGGSNVSMWVEGLDRLTPGVTPYNGNRCVGMEVVNGNRNEFNLNIEEIVSKEYSISEWLYLPTDWAIRWTDSDNFNWYSLCDTFMATGIAAPEPYYPYNELYIHQTNVGSNPPVFNIDSTIEDNTGSGLLTTVLGGNTTNLNNFMLPLGQWFNLKYFVFRDLSNGIVKIWVNDNLVVSQNGLKTENAKDNSFFTTISKIYYDPHDNFSGYKIWVDDLQVYDGLPPLPTQTKMTAPTASAILPLLSTSNSVPATISFIHQSGANVITPTNTSIFTNLLRYLHLLAVCRVFQPLLLQQKKSIIKQIFNSGSSSYGITFCDNFFKFKA
jgi:hypothetical protein